MGGNALMKTWLICGGRNFNNWDLFLNTMGHLSEERSALFNPNDNWLPHDIKIIHGGAKGADDMAGQWAAVNWCQCQVYPAQWEKHGRAAGPIRNQQMLDEEKVDLVVAFPGGRGTADMVARARKAGIEVIEASPS